MSVRSEGATSVRGVNRSDDRIIFGGGCIVRTGCEIIDPDLFIGIK
jgi:hypothetical protein